MTIREAKDLYLINYRLCEREAKRYEMDLYEFYVATCGYFDEFLSFLKNESRINNILYKKIKDSTAHHSKDELEIFRKLTNLSRKDVCFLLNYFITKTFFNEGYYTETGKVFPDGSIGFVYKKINDYNELMSLVNEYPDDFNLEQATKYSEPTLSSKDEFFEENWENIKIRMKDSSEVGQIAEYMWLLEDLHTDEVSKKVINELKKLLNSQLNTDI